MFADPKGARVVEKSALVATFTKGLELLKSRGQSATRLVAVSQTRLDDHYVFARVQFAWRFEPAATQPIEFDVHSTFLLRSDRGDFTIVLQQERDDFQQTLR